LLENFLDFFSFDGLNDFSDESRPKLFDWKTSTIGGLLSKTIVDRERPDALAGVSEFKAVICSIELTKEHSIWEYYDKRVRNKRGETVTIKKKRKKKVPAFKSYKIWVGGINDVTSVPVYIGKPTSKAQAKRNEAFIKILPDAYIQDGDKTAYAKGDVINVTPINSGFLTMFRIKSKVESTSNILTAITSLPITAPAPGSIDSASAAVEAAAAPLKCKYEDDDVVIPLSADKLLKEKIISLPQYLNFFSKQIVNINDVLSFTGMTEAKPAAIILGIMSYFTNGFTTKTSSIEGQETVELDDPDINSIIGLRYDVKDDELGQENKYGNYQKGDGVLFHRRGFFGLLGRKNYYFYESASLVPLTDFPNFMTSFSIAFLTLRIFIETNREILETYFDDRAKNKNLYDLLYLETDKEKKDFETSIDNWIKKIKKCT